MIIRGHYEQLYANILDNVDDGQSPRNTWATKLTQGAIENLTDLYLQVKKMSDQKLPNKIKPPD